MKRFPYFRKKTCIYFFNPPNFVTWKPKKVKRQLIYVKLLPFLNEKAPNFVKFLTKNEAVINLVWIKLDPNIERNLKEYDDFAIFSAIGVNNCDKGIVMLKTEFQWENA